MWFTPMSVLKLKHRVILSLSLIVCFGIQSSVLRAVDEDAQAEATAGETVHDKLAASDAHATESHPDTSVPMKLQTDLALWTLITFLCFLFVMKKFAWGPMIQGLDSREAGIQKAISDADVSRRKSHAMLAEYEQKLKAAEQTVQAMVAEARRDSERTSRDLLVNAQREVEAIKERAKDDIRQAKDTAIAEVFTQMNAQVVLATEHVLGRALQDGDQDRLVSQALAAIGR